MDDDGNILDVRQADDVGGNTEGWCIIEHQLQPQVTSSSLGLTPVLGMASDLSGMLANIMTSLEELRQDVTERIDRVEERAQQGHERLIDELAEVKLQARSEQAQLIRNIDQCLAETLALAIKEPAKISLG